MKWRGINRAVRPAAAGVWLGWLLSAQTLIPGGSNPMMIATDRAVMEAGEVRRDLPCDVTSSKPVLGFDLKFHSGYDITIPLKELAGAENQLTILFRVAPSAKPEQAVYFIQRIRVPSIEEEAKGDAYLQGSFDLGEGKYKVDWLMRDRTERVCANNWEVEAALPARDRNLALNATPNQILPSDMQQFGEEPPIERLNTDPLNVKVVINFAPQNSLAATLQPLDTSALVSILRTISREPRIARFSIVAFNLQEQRVIYRQEDGERIDFPAIGKALESVQLGRVDFAKLAQKNSETEFLSGLIREEMEKSGDNLDALIFAGPKVMLDQPVPQEVLKSLNEPAFPVFYMNYILQPQQIPWRDSISQAVRHFKGTEYTITRPRDLWFSVSEMVQKIVKFRAGRRTQPSALN